MNKINGFTITKLTLTGFKCFENTASFELGDTTLITASNGQGKSSIADAIAFAFVGTPFFGEKSLNRLQNHHMQEMEVRVDFIDDTQKSHNLTRIRKHDTTSICYDGLTVRQSDLNIAFGGKDIFLSIFNPLYFINVLGDTGKNLLEKLLPVVKHEEVLAALSSYSQEILANQSLLSPETFIKNRRIELKKCNETLISYKGQKELLDYQQKERISKLEQLKAEISNIVNEMKELTAIRYENIDFDVEKTKLAKLRKYYAELAEEIVNSNIEEDMQKMIKQIKEIERTIMQQNTKQYISQYTKQIAEMEADLKVLYAEHSKLNTALKNTVVGYQCPVCAAVITEENVAAVKTDLQQRLSTLICEGKAAKNNLNTIRIQDNTAQKAFEKQKTAELEKENNRLIDLKLQLQETHISYELDNEENREKLSKMEMQIKEQKQIWTLGIHDKKLISIIKAMLKAEIEGIGIPTKGVPQGGILSPLLANIVLNELDWWISSQWQTFETRHKYAGENNKYRALKNTNLKEIYIVRYADDFKIVCRTPKVANKIYQATQQWLKERLNLEINQEKSKITNVKKNYTEFLGYRIKVRKKKKKYVVKSKLTKKARKNVQKKIKEQVKILQKESTVNNVLKLNKIIAGEHNYYAYATMVCKDFARIDYNLSKCLKRRLKSLTPKTKKKKGKRNKTEKKGYKTREYLKKYDKYQGKPQILLGIYRYPIYGITTRTPYMFKQEICNYTEKGRELIHKELGCIDQNMLNHLINNPSTRQSIEFNDNRISKYVAQKGKCSISGITLNEDMQVHHIKPKQDGGTDEYSNLIIVSYEIHKLIHATKAETIKKYLSLTKLDKDAMKKLNKLRKSVGNDVILNDN